MAEIKLKIKKKLDFPLEADSITPDNLVGKTAADIKKLPLFYATKQVTIGDFFDVSGKSTEVSDTKIIIDGDVSNVKRIGEKMTAGEIVINSDVGMHIGNHMSGGKITVNNYFATCHVFPNSFYVRYIAINNYLSISYICRFANYIKKITDSYLLCCVK